MKYDLSIGTGQELNAKDLNKRSKRWLVKRVQWLQLLNKQAITDHAMELSSLREQLDTANKAKDSWIAEFNNAVDKASTAERDLKEARNKITNQRQVIAKLGNSIADLGECIAHL